MFKAKIKVIKFDKKGYTDALGAAIDVQIRQAAREWLRAVILKVPLYSGMARGSLLPLGRFLRVAIDTSPTEAAVKRRLPGAAAGELQQMFSFKSDKESFEWSFNFSTEVPHYLINEFNSGLGSPPLRNPTPWHSFEAGKIAWREYIQTEFKRKLPKLSDFISTEDIND